MRRKIQHHGLCKKGAANPVLGVWQQMIYRCTSPKNKRFNQYGGRGIRVCARWTESPAHFVADMGPRPDGYTLERINNNGHYSCGKCEECVANKWPANCRWATYREQAQNRNFRSAKWLEFRGERLLLVDWAKRLGMTPQGIHGRLKLGWTVEQCLTIPAWTGRDGKKYTRAGKSP